MLPFVTLADGARFILHFCISTIKRFARFVNYDLPSAPVATFNSTNEIDE
jgi:hypothetical protein